jgi:hypothetical protein
MKYRASQPENRGAAVTTSIAPWKKTSRAGTGRREHETVRRKRESFGRTRENCAAGAIGAASSP